MKRSRLWQVSSDPSSWIVWMRSLHLWWWRCNQRGSRWNYMNLDSKSQGTTMCWTLEYVFFLGWLGGEVRYAVIIWFPPQQQLESRWSSATRSNEVFKSLNKQEVREIAELEFRKTFKRCIWAVKIVKLMGDGEAMEDGGKGHTEGRLARLPNLIPYQLARYS